MTTGFEGDWASGYDRRVRSVIPAYEAVHHLAGVALRHHLPEAARLLVVGCGTGMEIGGLALRRPQWHFTGVDTSSAMLDVARRRIAALGVIERVALFDGELAALTEEGFDGATLILVLQFLPDDGEKLALLSEIARRLKPGGRLIVYDALGERDSPELGQWIELWKAYAVEAGLTQRYVEEDLQKRRDRLRPVTETRLMALFSGAGFESVERFCSAFLFHGWMAVRQG